MPPKSYSLNERLDIQKEKVKGELNGLSEFVLSLKYYATGLLLLELGLGNYSHIIDSWHRYAYREINNDEWKLIEENAKRRYDEVAGKVKSGNYTVHIIEGNFRIEL